MSPFSPDYKSELVEMFKRDPKPAPKKSKPDIQRGRGYIGKLSESAEDKAKQQRIKWGSI